MAQTDSRAGFRLPWSSERSTDSTETEHSELDTTSETGWTASDQPAQVDESAPRLEAVDTPPAAPEDTSVDTATESAHAVGPTSAAPRKPSKFLADLTKAMQAAAEEARALSLSQFQADAKTYVEKIHDRSATEAAGLRRAADDDVAAVREWSKAEIARIREDTETRITARKGRLESEIEDHVALIEREIQGVQARVASFEQQMDDFFARLLGEDDPTRFATMAERLPEPPTFEEMSSESAFDAPADRPEAVGDPEAEVAEPVAEEVVEPPADALGEAEPAEPDEASETAEAMGEAQSSDPVLATGSEDSDGDGAEAGEATNDPEIDREAAFAAIQAAAEAAASAEVASDAAARAEAVADIIEIVGAHEEAETDERVAALGLTPDFDAAEAEAAEAAEATDAVEEIPVIGDEALAARLADLLPGKQDETDGTHETKTTQVVVVGLVSVASIASFKRHLGRLAGVASVGVSSGPDGEFLFAVHHAADVVLRDVIPSMPSFQARVTGSGEGTLNVTAHDPESDN